MRLRTQFDGILSIIIVDNATLCYLASICNLVRVHVCFVYLTVLSVVKALDT